MSTATSGRAREHRVIKRFEDAGWLKVMRSAGSKGAADFIAVHPFHGLALVQVGTENKEIACATKTCEHDGKSAAQCGRDRFVTLAEACGALALLASCSPGVPPTFWQVTRDTASTWERWPL
jgi:hypothetical protein